MRTEEPIVVEQFFDVPLPRVWRAITDPEEMRQWFFEEMEAFQPVEGFETEFTVRSGERNFLHRWRIEEALPPTRITYDWRYGGFPGESRVSFELSEEDGGTRLTLTHEGVESFPRDVPEFTRESCRGGWELFLQQRLRSFLEGE